MKMYSSCREFTGDKPLDGCLDGWSCQAWAGDTIAYGTSHEGALKHLAEKLHPTLAARAKAGDRVAINTIENMVLNKEASATGLRAAFV